MTGISLKRIINESFIQRFQGVAKKQSSGNNLASTLNGQSTKITVSQGLRQGAQTYANAIQGLNAIGSVVNLARFNLQELSEVTDKLISLTERATLPTSSKQTRRQLNSQFRKLGKEFQDIVENAKNGERDILSKEDLQELFVIVGLDSTSSESVADFFSSLMFSGDDELLASDETKADRPLGLPPSAYKKTITISDGMGGRIEKEIRQTPSPDTKDLFDAENSIVRRVDAFKNLEDLKAVKQQIDDNLDALDDGVDFLQNVSDLIRATGLAMLEISDTITGEGDAFQVARELRAAIRKDAPAALAHADLLDPIAAAALLLDEDSLS